MQLLVLPEAMQFIHSGYACRVVRRQYNADENDNTAPSWLCGYVQLPANHAWFNATYDEIAHAIAPHFEGMLQPDLSWMHLGEVGFDTNHFGLEFLTIDDVANMTRQLAAVLQTLENVPMGADEDEVDDEDESDYDPADE
jgi:hypothetical protein